MKAKKTAIALLLSMIMVLSALLVLVACNKDDADIRWDFIEKNANMWRNGDPGIYDIKEEGGKLVLDYTSTGGKTDVYQYVSGAFGASAEDKAKFKTLVLTASMTTTAEWSTLLVKLGDGDNAREFNFELSSTEKTYEVDVSDFELATKNGILLFPDGGWRDVTGKVTISELYLTDRAINEENRATAYQLPAANPLPTDAAWNHITSEEKFVNAGWYDDGRGIYKSIEKQQDGSYKITAQRKTHQDYWYNALLAFVDSDATTMSAIQSFKLTVKAPKGTLIAVKPFDFYEVKATVPDDKDNQEFTIEVDVTGFTQAKVKDEQGNPTEEFAHSFAKPTGMDKLEAQNTVRVIWETGNGKANGTFTIVSAEFSTDKAKPMYTAKEITATDRKVGTEWFSYDFGVYTPSVDPTDNSVNVHYDKGTLEWPYMYTYVKGAALENMTTLTVKVKGPEGVGILVKPYNQQKDSFLNITFTGAEQTIVLDISDLTVADWTADQQILIFIGGGTKELEGDFTIYSMEYGTGTVTPGPVTPETTQYADGLKLDVNKNFPATSGDYTSKTVEGNTVITYASQSGYSAIETKVNLGTYKMNYAKFRIKGPEGANCMFGVGASANEYKFQEGAGNHGKLTGDWQEVTVKLTAEVTGEVRIYVIAGYENSVAGDLEIDYWDLYYVGVVANGEQTLDINKNWTAAKAESTRYTIVTAEGKTTVTYKGTHNYDFDPIILYVDLGQGGYSTLTIKFKGPQGGCTTFSVGGSEKAFESGNPNGAMTGQEQTVTYDVSELSGLVEIKLFVGWDYENTDADATFEISQAQITKAAA